MTTKWPRKYWLLIRSLTFLVESSTFWRDQYFLSFGLLLTIFSRNRAKLDHRSITQLMSNEFAHVSKFNHMVDNVCFIFTSASFNFIIGRLSKFTNQGWHNSVDRVMKFYSHYEIRIKSLNHIILKICFSSRATLILVN